MAPPAIRRPRGPLIAGVVCGTLVLVALVIGGILIVGGDSGSSGDDDQAGGDSTPSASERPEDEDVPDDGSPDSGPQESPSPEEGAAELAEGVVLPVLGGWDRTEGSGGAAVLTSEAYPCPEAPDKRCVRGGASVLQAPATAKSAERMARRDIRVNVQEAYGSLGYGGIDSHDEVAAESVRVAGEKGYRVQWKVKTEEGTGAYVESVAFPHPGESDALVVLRSSVDIHDDAPARSALEKLRKGVREGAVQEDDGNSEPVRDDVRVRAPASEERTSLASVGRDGR